MGYGRQEGRSPRSLARRSLRSRIGGLATVKRPRYRLGSLNTPGLLNQLRKLVGVDCRKAHQDSGKASVVVVGEELGRVRSNERLFFVLVGDTHRQYIEVQGTAFLAGHFLGVVPAKALLANPKARPFVNRLRKREGDSLHIVCIGHEQLIPMQKINKAGLGVGLDELHRDAVAHIQPMLVAGDAALDGRLQQAGVDFPVLGTGNDGIEDFS